MLLTHVLGFSQNSDLNFDPEKVGQIKLYRFNKSNFCDQSKGLSIIYNNKLSPCFDYLKSLDKNRSKSIIKLLLSKKSYGEPFMVTFDTDYAITVYDNVDKLIGWINFSQQFQSSRSTPRIEVQEIQTNGPIKKDGLVKKSRKKLIKLLDIDSSK